MKINKTTDWNSLKKRINKYLNNCTCKNKVIKTMKSYHEHKKHKFYKIPIRHIKCTQEISPSVTDERVYR